MKRSRSPAFDFNSQNPSAEEYRAKVYIYSISGMYLNFAYNSFIKYSELDKTKVREHISGFAHNFGNGTAKEALIRHLGQYLEPKDFANIRLVCKPQI